MEEKIGFQPSKVLKIYKQSHKNNYYMELHSVVRGPDNEYILDAGSPLTQNMMRQLISAVHLKEAKDGYFDQLLIDQRILSTEPLKHRRHIIWYDKPMARKMLFTDGHQLKSGIYSLPGILYFLSAGKLRVFTFKPGNRRPNLQTPLYYPPLFNTIGDFQFCWGSVRARTDGDIAVDTEMKMWEDFLWNSKWSHSQHKYEKMYKATKNGTVRFNPRHLSSAGMNLEGAMQRYL